MVTQVTKCDKACRASVCDQDGQIRGQSKNQASDYTLLSQYSMCMYMPDYKTSKTRS
jgi:hypothetical protein